MNQEINKVLYLKFKSYCFDKRFMKYINQVFFKLIWSQKHMFPILVMVAKIFECICKARFSHIGLSFKVWMDPNSDC
jgi:hypothetical protein